MKEFIFFFFLLKIAMIDFLAFNFSSKDEIYQRLQKEILIASQEDKNKFFFDDSKSDSWKMIIYLIFSNRFLVIFQILQYFSKVLHVQENLVLQDIKLLI